MIKLNGWQRLWVVLMVISFGGSFIVFVELAPKEDMNIIKDIRKQECSYLLKLPDGYKIDVLPDKTSTCFYLLSLRYTTYSKISNTEDYRALISEQKLDLAILIFIWWIGLIVGTYLFGLSVAWIVSGFKKR